MSVFPYIIKGQTASQNISNQLVQKGYYNVITWQEDSLLYISYENKLFLNEGKAVFKLLKTIKKDLNKSISGIVLILTSGQLPIAQINLKIAFKNELVDFTHLNIATDTQVDQSIWEKVKKRLRYEYPYVYDIAIAPQLKTELGNFEDPWKVQINLAPRINLSLWRGMTFSAQVIIPLHNELATFDGDYIRPGILALSQAFRFPNDYFGVVSVGRFTLNRYGTTLNFRKYFPKKLWYVGLEAGYTGKMTYREGGLKNQGQSTVHAVGELGYFLPKYDLLLYAQYGKYLFDDVSFKVGIERKFKRIDIGFFGIYSNGIKNVGARISVSIYPAQLKYGNIHPARTFDYQHIYSQHQFEGYMMETNYPLRQLDRLLLPGLLKNQLFNLNFNSL